MSVEAQGSSRWYDLFLPAGERTIPVERYRTTALIRLFVVIPFAVGLTDIYLYQTIDDAWNPTHGYRAWLAHFCFVLLYVLVNSTLIWLSRARSTPNPAVLRQANSVAVLCELGTNQAFMVGFGCLASYASGYLILVIAVYTVLFDYRTAVTTFFLGVLLFILFGILEATGTIPLSPLLPNPISEPYWSAGTNAVAPIFSVVIVSILTFLICTYAVNQSVRLHQYITRSVLQRYLPPALVDRAADGDLSMDAAPERRLVTVMFTDIVGFTRLSEALGAEAVGEILNKVLAEVADVAHAHGATVDKFIGDCAMMVFGAPEPLPPADQARRALALAKAIHIRIPEVGKEHGLQARTGINTGEAVVGNFGSAARADYTVIGPAVNVAARLEGMSRPDGILLGEDTVKHLDEKEHLCSAGPLTLKGVSHPVQGWFYDPKSDNP